MQIVLSRKEMGDIIAAHLAAQGRVVKKVGFKASYEVTPGSPARIPKSEQSKAEQNFGQKLSAVEELFGQKLVVPTVKTTDFVCLIEIE